MALERSRRDGEGRHSRATRGEGRAGGSLASRETVEVQGNYVVENRDRGGEEQVVNEARVRLTTRNGEAAGDVDGEATELQMQMAVTAKCWKKIAVSHGLCVYESM